MLCAAVRSSLLAVSIKLGDVVCDSQENCAMVCVTVGYVSGIFPQKLYTIACANLGQAEGLF